MKSFAVAAISFTAITTARPSYISNHVRDEPASVHVFPTNVTGADKNAFPPAPANLDPSQKAFLEKYQPLSDAALAKVSPINQGFFSAAGFCYSEYPCLSVNKAAVATIGDKEEVETGQVSAILDQLTSSPQAEFAKVPGNIFTGLRITQQGAVLEVISPPGSMDSKVLGGMVFDMFKLQSDDVTTNSIRATQAKTDNGNSALLALCLYPDGADTQQTYQFCIGNQLDGSPLPTVSSNAKRDIGGISGFLCSFVDIPLLC